MYLGRRNGMTTTGIQELCIPYGCVRRTSVGTLIGVKVCREGGGLDCTVILEESHEGVVINRHPANWSVDFRLFCEIALVGLKTH